jgi:hypothetical protein
MARQERATAMVVTSDHALARSAEACGAAVIESTEFEARMALAAAIKEGEPAEEETRRSRVSTRKKGAGRRLPKRLRQSRMKTAKL